MHFKMVHNNLNVLNLEKSLHFYKEALGLTEQKRVQAEDGSFTLVYLGDGASGYLLELTCLAGRQEAYDLGDNEVHLAFETDDYNAAYEKHKNMGIICFENPEMGIYFIEDPDGYWMEVIPKRM